MATRKLGPAGAEITLPPITVALPVTVGKNIERAEMSDGSGRYNFLKGYKVWEPRFPKLTKTELDDLIYLRSLNQILRWQDTDESTTWYDVVITNFSYDSVDPISTTKLYKATMTLEEVV